MIFVDNVKRLLIILNYIFNQKRDIYMYIYIGQDWRIGLEHNHDNSQIDRSVWKENDYLDNRVNVNDLKVWLYVLEDILNKDVFKIGITYSPYKRCDQINKRCRGKHQFRVKEQKFIGERSKAFTLEQAILSVLSPYRMYKRYIFDGSTEILKIDKNKVLMCYQSLARL